MSENLKPTTDHRPPVTGIKASAEDFIPLSVPSIQGNEWKYIKECLDTNWVSSVGSFVDRFESELAGYVDQKYAVAMSNGTAALHIALLVAGVQPGDEVIVPALTFVSPANTIKYVGAHPVFMDVEPDYLQIDPQKLADFIELECSWQDGDLRNSQTGRRIAAIIPVDLLGHPVDMTPIADLAKKYNFKIIEDATESLGAKYQGKHVGSLADIACFSFNGNKIITTGGGGMLVTDNKEYADKARYLSTQAKDDPVEYLHNEMGYNYRMTNLLAAMGCAQLENLDSYVAKKHCIAAAYDKIFSDIPGIRIPLQAEWAESTYWLYTVLVDREKYGMGSRELLNSLAEEKIQSRPLWHPINTLPYFKDYQSYKVEHAYQLYNDGLSIPCSVDLTEQNQQRVINAITSNLC